MTAKLSREFYDRFGEKVVDELVDCCDDMDETFRAELRALNDQNFERLERRMAELKAELIKWMFLFWPGTVATMLGIAPLLVG